MRMGAIILPYLQLPPTHALVIVLYTRRTVWTIYEHTASWREILTCV